METNGAIANGMEARNAVINRLKDFISKAKLINDYDKILEDVFDLHFRVDDKADIITQINIHICEVFHADGMALLDYLQSTETFTPNILDMDPGKYRNIINCINNLKIKYGVTIRKLANAQKSPFLINTVESSVSGGQTLHKIKISRGDGNYLEGLFSPESLMALITALTNSMEIAMKQGIYNLNNITLKNYLEEVNQLSEYLDNIIKSSDETIQKAVLVDKHE